MAINARHIKSLILKSEKQIEEKSKSLPEHQIFAQQNYFHGAFEIETEEQMLCAGKHFAAAALLDNKKYLERIRLGLLGTPGAGKSTFSEGFLGSISQASLVYNSEFARVFNSESAGKIIHYDAGYNELLQNEPIISGNPGMDIVEHAEYAIDPMFDYLIHFTYSADGGTRHIALLADQESEESMKLKNFVNALKL